MGGEGRSKSIGLPRPGAGRAVGTALFLLAILNAGPAAADATPENHTRLEFFSGSGATAGSSFGYAGGVWALRRGADSPGFRIKALGGFGEYAYDGSIALAGGTVPFRFKGEVILGELLTGYQWRKREWTVKAYAGVEYARHDIAPDDPSNRVQGGEWGAKLQLEAWRNLGSRSFFSLDGSYGSAFGDYRVQGRLGHRFLTWLSAGLEAGGLGNEAYDAGRGGAFLRFHLGRMDLTLSGGATGDYLDGEPSAYVAFGVYRKM